EEPKNKNNVVEEKIISAFCDIAVPRLPGLLQFWSLGQTDNGIRFVSCTDQPFALEDLDPRHHFYRLACIKFRCNIDHDDNYDPYKRYTVEEKGWLIENSPVATAFLNRFPDVVLDLRSLRGTTPLVEVALRCGFTSLILLPVFDHNSSCVGVVECCMKVAYLFIFLQELKSALERAGLSTYHVQESLPFETIHGLKLATYEIEVALKTLCESHQLSLAQVWIANDSENHAPCSSSLEVIRTKQKLVVKLAGYFANPLDDHLPMPHIYEYYDTCNVLPLKMREVSIVGKTLETYQPHFCRNLNKLMVNGPLGLLLSLCKCSCLAICLRSAHTGDNVDYVFEFLWPRGRNYSIVLESLLLNLKRCLPSFKFASGQELGGELRVVDFQNSTRSGVGSFEVLKLEQGMVKEEDDHKQQHQGTMKEAATNLYGQGPNSLKRKLTDLSKGSYILYSDPFWNVDDDMPVTTSYMKKTATITIRSSYILIDAMEKIEEEFMLDPETYTLEYQAEGSWFKLETDVHLAGLRKCY
ncbi:hypothetical protein Tco_0622793, partial [Tanacetum coccineum]